MIHSPNKTRTHLLLLAAFFLGTSTTQADPPRARLMVSISGMKNDKGQVVAKLFRAGEDAPRGPSYRRALGPIRSKQAQLSFAELPPGNYALFVFHDENKNTTVDHNWLGFPNEALGFSGGFELSLLSGVPDFEDLEFEFDGKNGHQNIFVK